MAGKYERDAATVDAILAKGDAITHADRMQLLTIYQVSYHDSGKIEGIFSLDSSAHGCSFCAKMCKAAEKDPSIICGRCYDYKQETYRTNVLNRHALNLKIMSNVDFTIDELSLLPAGELVRINSSGDIENECHAGNMVKYALAHPAASVALWSKNTPAVLAAFRKYGKPSNMVYIVSSIHINNAAKLPEYADYTFTVYTGDAIEGAMAAGACECNGKKCRDCGYKCYRRAWPAGANIAEKLR